MKSESWTNVLHAFRHREHLVLQEEGDTPRCQKMFGNVQFSVSIHTHRWTYTACGAPTVRGEVIYSGVRQGFSEAWWTLCNLSGSSLTASTSGKLWPSLLFITFGLWDILVLYPRIRNSPWQFVFDDRANRNPESCRVVSLSGFRCHLLRLAITTASVHQKVQHIGRVVCSRQERWAVVVSSAQKHQC